MNPKNLKELKKYQIGMFKQDKTIYFMAADVETLIKDRIAEKQEDCNTCYIKVCEDQICPHECEIKELQSLLGGVE